MSVNLGPSRTCQALTARRASRNARSASCVAARGGDVFRDELRGKGHSLRELKTAQDWILERQFKQVPGAVDVVSFGGETKQYQVNVDRSASVRTE